MKKIVIFGTGGTISGYSESRMDLKDYISGSYRIEQLIEKIDEIKNMAEVEVVQMTNFSSTNVTPSHWVSIKKKIEDYLNNKGFDGVVVTHGTNTIEETAYFLHLTVNSSKPIVLVGAQRPPSSLGTDAFINLINAVKVALNPQAHNKGVLVVLNDEINSAREVTKTNTYRLETFKSGQLGFLGYVDPDNTVQFYRSPTRKHTVYSRFSKLAINNLPRVPIIYSYAGADGSEIMLTIQHTDCSGIVVAGTGAGKVSKQEEEALRRAVDLGIVVVRSSRVGDGRVVDLECYKDLNFISGDNLLPQKARILLMLSLLEFNNKEKIQEIFDEY